MTLGIPSLCHGTIPQCFVEEGLDALEWERVGEGSLLLEQACLQTCLFLVNDSIDLLIGCTICIENVTKRRAKLLEILRSEERKRANCVLYEHVLVIQNR